MQKNKKTLLGLFILFICLLSLTIYTSFSSNIDTQEIIIKSMTPVYDETSGVVVSDEGVVFNDKNQVVKYNVVLENTQDYDVKISDIKLSTPSEEFLDYKVEGISTDDVVEANSTKELVVSFETMRIDGWGRNFADELTANISFEKVVEEVTPPAENDKEEDKQPEAPATSIEEIKTKSEKIEVNSITNNTIEFKGGIKLEDGEKVAVWIYSKPKFLGYFDVVVTNGVKQIVGLEEALKKAEITTGEHSIVLETEDKEVLGYVDIYINEDKELLIEKPQDITDEEDSIVNKPSGSKPSTDKEETSKEDEEEKIENPYTSDKGLLVVLIVATGVTGVAIIIVSKNKFTKYTVFILMLSPIFTITNAEEVIEVSLKNNVSFESQNVMKRAYELDQNNNRVFNDYWQHREKIKNFYIQSEITEIEEYEYKFDVTEYNNEKVIAFMVKNQNNNNYYDVYLMADGIIYPNIDASYYFADMKSISLIENIKILDTSNVTNMSHMFYNTGCNSEDFLLDLSSLNTGNVTNLAGMFYRTGYINPEFTMDVSSFDTSKVTNMNSVFAYTGYSSEKFELDVSNFNTSNVTNMKQMFAYAGYNNTNFTLDVSNFDTSNVTNMSGMFGATGYNSTIFSVDVSGFDTSKVTNMSNMFYCLGYNNKDITLDISNFDTSNVTNMSGMFSGIAYNSNTFTFDISTLNTSKVTNMSLMFASAAIYSKEIAIDLSNFDTSKLTNTKDMFVNFGRYSTKLNTSLTIKNPNLNSYDNMFLSAALNFYSKISINYTIETEDLVEKMIATKSTNSNVVKGNLIVDVDNLSTGDEIHISGEKFNVISQTDDTITMLAQYNVDDSTYKQTTTQMWTEFSVNKSWEYTPGPKEIDIQNWYGDTKTLLNSYVSYLQTVLGDTTISANLITLKELEMLGCTIPSDYSWISDSSYRTCDNSSYNSWLINNQRFWTRSAYSGSSRLVWVVYPLGWLDSDVEDNISSGVRPVITISKDTLKNYLKTS